MKGKTSAELKAAYEARVRSLEEALERRERELAVLSQVASRIHGEAEPRTILNIALEEMLSGMDLKAAWVFMGNETDRTLHLAAQRGVSSRYVEEIGRHGLGECLCPEVFWSGHAMVARNTTQCPRMPQLVEANEATEPGHVGLLRPPAIAAHLQSLHRSRRPRLGQGYGRRLDGLARSSEERTGRAGGSRRRTAAA